jgi:hypothetical protein
MIVLTNHIRLLWSRDDIYLVWQDKQLALKLCGLRGWMNG